MKKLPDQPGSSPPRPIRALDPGARATIHGGDPIGAPRDPQAGLPTGHRG